MEENEFNLKGLIVAAIVIILFITILSGCGYSLPEKDSYFGVYTASDAEGEEYLSKYAQVLGRAEYYSSILNLSKAMIHDKLIKNDGYSEEEADFAVENISADWKENALLKAETYRRALNMSDRDIYRQLTASNGEKFTQEEADYAIDNLG